MPDFFGDCSEEQKSEITNFAKQFERDKEKQLNLALEAIREEAKVELLCQNLAYPDFKISPISPGFTSTNDTRFVAHVVPIKAFCQDQWLLQMSR